MKTIRKSTLSGLFAGILASHSALAADVSPLVNYQGYVTDSNGDAIGIGSPVNRKMLFKVYDAASGGNLLWTEEHTATLSEGRFSVLLGNGAQFGSDAHDGLNSVFATASVAEYYVGITVDDGDDILNGTDTEISPRQRIVSSVFALRAASADSVTAGTDLSLGTDHGLGLYSGSKQFGGNTINGPVLYGNGGGVLGSQTGSTQTTALSWDAAGKLIAADDLDVTGDLDVAGNLTLAKTLDLGVAGKLNLNQRKLNFYGPVDTTNYMQYVAAPTQGPGIYGYDGGILGANSPTKVDTLKWNKDGVNITGGLTATGTVTGAHITTGGTVTASVLSSGGTITGRNGHFTASELGTTFGQGAHIEWNRMDNNGSTYIMNHKGTGIGGIRFGEVTSDKTFTLGMFLTADGLSVEGNVAADGKSVVTGEEMLRMLRGTVSLNGVITHGSGYTVTKSATVTGLYLVNFNTDFSSIPSVTANIKEDVATQAAINTSRHHGFVTIMNTNASSFWYKVYGGDGVPNRDLGVTFIVMGPR